MRENGAARIVFPCVQNFPKRSIFPGGSSLDYSLITSDDVLAREIKCVCACVYVCVCVRNVFVCVSQLFDRCRCYAGSTVSDRTLGCRSSACYRYKVGSESRWWCYAAAAVAERVSEPSRWPHSRGEGPWNWIRAPSFCRCFPPLRESPPGRPGPAGPWMTASVAWRTTRQMWGTETAAQTTRSV